MASPRRILLKLSGEAFKGPEGAFSPPALARIAAEIAPVSSGIGIVIGAGNIVRGGRSGLRDRVEADTLGMLATVMNALALRPYLEAEGRDVFVQSAVSTELTDPVSPRDAKRALDQGAIVLFAGGTGSPLVTTDTAAALRAVSIGADLLAMRVLLVDDDDQDAQRTETGVRVRLGDAVTIRRAGSLSQAIRALITEAFDVVLLELDVPDAAGIATLAGIRGTSPGTPVVVYSRLLDDTLALRALRAGAQECLAKQDTAPEQVGRSLRLAIERHRRLVTLEAERSEAAHRATHDPLTGLANRELFHDHLNQALAFGALGERPPFFVDLDGFKGINDLHGHARGDSLLRVVATPGRLRAAIRAVGRLSGDNSWSCCRT
jgi:uridylate kinase